MDSPVARRRLIQHRGPTASLYPASAEVGAFPADRATRGGVSAATPDQALNALVFLYGEVLGQPLGEAGGIVRAKPLRKWPVVLAPE